MNEVDQLPGLSADGVNVAEIFSVGIEEEGPKAPILLTGVCAWLSGRGRGAIECELCSELLASRPPIPPPASFSSAITLVSPPAPLKSWHAISQPARGGS